MTSLRGVVFDLDGTLVESESLWTQAEIAVAAAGGVAWNEDDAFAWFGRPLRDMTQAIVDRGLDIGVDEAIERMLDHIADAYRQSVPWMPGARELLAALRAEDVLAAIGTMSFRRVAMQVHDAAPATTFEAVVAGDELIRGKPDPEVFLTAIACMGLTPADVVVVEDSPTGVAAAVASGAAVLAVPPTEEVRLQIVEHHRVSVARSLAQLDVGRLRDVRAGARLDLW